MASAKENLEKAQLQAATAKTVNEVAILRAQKDSLMQALAKIHRITVNSLTKSVKGKSDLDVRTDRGIALDDIRVIASSTVKANSNPKG